MTTKNFFRSILLCTCLMSLAGCGDDDEILFPEGTSSLRMMNEDNGKTLLGNSDVYITNGGNFRSVQSPIFDMGKKGGIADIDMPDFVNMAPEVAVEPGHGYVVCNANDVREFPSGELAIATSAYVYRIFVDSWITQDNANVGANVRFLRSEASQGVLPEFDSAIGPVYVDPYVSIDEQKPFTLQLPGSGSEVEVELLDGNDLAPSVSISGNTLQILPAYAEYDTDYFLRIRYRNIYTQVTFRIEQKELI